MTKSITLKYNIIIEEEKYLYKVYFYEDKNGDSSIINYLSSLRKREDKDSRIKSQKIQDYIKALREYGLQLREPYIKHLDGEIWELRPLKDRILFVASHKDSFVLLHYFTKKTQKTPRREIEKAKKELEDIIERGLFL